MATITLRTALGLVAGVCGTLFASYCYYFDLKRHQDPDFKKKLRERRRMRKTVATNKHRTIFPNLKDNEAVQRFFLQQVQMGEELLSAGDLANGVEHFGNAVAVCGKPNELLQVLQHTMPPQLFHLLINRLPHIAPQVIARERKMQDEDIE